MRMRAHSQLIVIGLILAAVAIVGVLGFHSLVYLKDHFGNHKLLCSIATLGLAGSAWVVVWYLVVDLWPYWCVRGPSLYERYGWGCVLITGASDGIGFAYSKRLASMGFELIMHGRNKAKLEEKKAEILQLYPQSKIRTVIADLSLPLSEEQKRDFLDATEHQPLSILINNAGVGPSGAFAHMESWMIPQTVCINVLAPTELMKMFMPRMLAQGKLKCAVINISSMASVALLPQQALYTGTKAYLSALTRCVAHENVHSNIDFLNMMPGAVLTQIFIEKSELTAVDADYAAEKQLTFVGRRLDSFGVAIHWVCAYAWVLSPWWIRRRLSAYLLHTLAPAKIKPN